MLEPFEAPKLKIERAHRHLRELETEITAYFHRKPMVLMVEKPAGLEHHGAHSWTVRIREPVPIHLSPIIGDIIHNLRASLDLLACDLVRIAGKSTKGVNFPFCDNPNKLDDFIKLRNLTRAGPEVVALVKSLKPYKGGNIALRAIHDFDIRDKHEALIPLVSAGASPSANVRFSPGGGITPIPSISSRISEDGQHLLITIPIPGVPLGTELPAAFALIFGFDGSPFDGHEILNTLRHFTEATESAIQLFIGRFDKPVASPSTSSLVTRRSRKPICAGS